MKSSLPTRLIAITGGSGAGKTWLADRLHHFFGDQAGRLTQDSFYRDRSHLSPARRAQINFDHPGALDWTCFRATLESVLAGQPARVPTYDYATHSRTVETVALEARPVVLVDGLWLLHRPEIRRLFSLRIYLQCPEAERLRRRMVRDRAERGRSVSDVRRQFRATVAPMHERFVDPQARRADLVLTYPNHEISELQEALWGVLPGQGRRLNRSRELFGSQLQTLLQPAA